MRKIQALLILEEDTKQLNKIYEKIDLYKSMPIDTVKISLGNNLNEKYLEDLFSLNKKFASDNLLLMIKVNLLEVSKNLLGVNYKNESFDEPKIQKASFSFLNFLVKRGIRAFDFGDINYLVKNNPSDKKIIDTSRLINKNLRSLGKDVISLCDLSYKYIDLYDILTGDSDFDFSYICRPINIFDEQSRKLLKETYQNGGRISYKIGFSKSRSKNLSFVKESLILTSLTLLDLPLYIKDSESYFDVAGPIESIRDYLGEILKIKNNLHALPRKEFYEIIKKDKDIYSYSLKIGDNKFLFIGNLTQKEILVNISMYVSNYSEYKLLLGNYGKRTIVKNILLRSYEGLIFVRK
ncbi:hypothetical protein [Anaerococcus prevotii]|uniref:hypothetical protein n=1 Tax=Anaerococcus prevotii TaxID=33034 RepID=UPI00159D82E1|nr:hypothetical protein [Anaerococcus prevotii]